MNADVIGRHVDGEKSVRFSMRSSPQNCPGFRRLLLSTWHEFVSSLHFLAGNWILDLKASPRAQKVESRSLPKCAKAILSAEHYSRVIPLSFNQISIQAIKDCFGSCSISTNDGRPSTKLGRNQTKTFSHSLQLLS